MDIVTKKSRNIWVYVLGLFMLSGMIAGIIMGQKQDDTYKQYTAFYKGAQEKLQKQDFRGAEEDFSRLVQVQPQSYMVRWTYGITLMLTGNYQDAERQLRKAREAYPFIVQNQKFVAQYGEVMYRTGNMEQARRYFEETQRLNTDPNLSAQIAPVLHQLEQQAQKK